jgi:crossover junction endodeoxyribonuclease RuvC
VARGQCNVGPGRVLGIDPGLNITGYAVIEPQGQRARLIEAGVVRGKGGATLAERVRDIYQGVSEVIASLAPNVVAVEELYSHYERPRTAILMGHARGVICLSAAMAEIPLCSYASTQVKRMLTGNGRAPKAQIQRAICHEFGLVSPPEPPDVADAMAIALCHHYLSRDPAAAL